MYVSLYKKIRDIIRDTRDNFSKLGRREQVFLLASVNNAMHCWYICDSRSCFLHCSVWN